MNAMIVAEKTAVGGTGVNARPAGSAFGSEH
jgi:hypothetical protein